MKPRNNKDISILLYALLLFSFGIGWVYSRNIKEDNQTKDSQLSSQVASQKVSQETVTQKISDQIETLLDTAVTQDVATPEAKTPEPQKAPEAAKAPEEAKTPEIKTPEPEKASKPIVELPKIPELPEPPAEVTYDIEKATKEEELTTREIIIYSKEFIRSKNMNNLVAILKERCPKKIIVETISKILELDAIHQELTRPEKLKIVLALAKHYENDKELQSKIFDIITKYKDLETGKIPLLFVAVEIKEIDVIPALVEWYKKSDRPEVRNLADISHDYAAKNDYGQVIKRLKDTGVKITPERATELLWTNLKANKTKKDSVLIESLKSLGANLNSPDPKTQITPLIQAIKNKNLHAVKQLVKFGADPKLASKDKSVGFPLQVARELGQLNIEMFLRDKGARD
jgi:hypothetical protein